MIDLTLQLEKEEKDLIQACVNQERWAQKVLYESYYGLLMGICLRYANHSEDALDILHEGYIKVFKHISKYKPGTSLSAWMRRIMVNTAIDYYRKESRRRTEDISQAFQLSTPDPSPLSQMTVKEVMACIQLLSPAYRSVFNLYVIEGYPHKEIAEMLGITESTSRSNLVKARIKLRELLKVRSLDEARSEV